MRSWTNTLEALSSRERSWVTEKTKGLGVGSIVLYHILNAKSDSRLPLPRGQES
jgi:hypothetical protein